MRALKTGRPGIVAGENDLPTNLPHSNPDAQTLPGKCCIGKAISCGMRIESCAATMNENGGLCAAVKHRRVCGAVSPAPTFLNQSRSPLKAISNCSKLTKTL
jgi:hypothetical protein